MKITGIEVTLCCWEIIPKIFNSTKRKETNDAWTDAKFLCFRITREPKRK